MKLSARQRKRKKIIEQIAQIIVENREEYEEKPKESREELIRQIMFNFYVSRRTASEYIQVAEEFIK